MDNPSCYSPYNWMLWLSTRFFPMISKNERPLVRMFLLLPVKGQFSNEHHPLGSRSLPFSEKSDDNWTLHMFPFLRYRPQNLFMTIFSTNRKLTMKLKWKGIELKCYKTHRKSVPNDPVALKSPFLKHENDRA